MRNRQGLLLAALLCAAPAVTIAAEEDGDAHGDGHSSHLHHVSLTVGAADNGHLDETGFSVGAEYRYALNERFAIGPMLDYTTYDHEETTLLVAALFWRPYAGRFQLFGGPGVEFVNAEHQSTHVTPVPLSSSVKAEDDDDSEFAWRLGAGYDVPVGKLSLTPLVSADFIDGHTTWVYGIALGYGF
jgi:opacity protein-like surface antigen